MLGLDCARNMLTLRGSTLACRFRSVSPNRRHGESCAMGCSEPWGSNRRCIAGAALFLPRWGAYAASSELRSLGGGGVHLSATLMMRSMAMPETASPVLCYQSGCWLDQIGSSLRLPICTSCLFLFPYILYCLLLCMGCQLHSYMSDSKFLRV